MHDSTADIFPHSIPIFFPLKDQFLLDMIITKIGVTEYFDVGKVKR